MHATVHQFGWIWIERGLYRKGGAHRQISYAQSRQRSMQNLFPGAPEPIPRILQSCSNFPKDSLTSAELHQKLSDLHRKNLGKGGWASLFKPILITVEGKPHCKLKCIVCGEEKEPSNLARIYGSHSSADVVYQGRCMWFPTDCIRCSALALYARN